MNEEYIRELHNRNYSLYASPRLEKQALDELHEQDYMIFDEDETLQLYEDYDKELKTEYQALPEYRPDDMSGVFQSKNSIMAFKATTSVRADDSKDDAEQLLYLKMDRGVYRHCDAIGTYESSTNRFTIKAGSIITLNVLPGSEGTERSIKRNAFIALSCDKRSNGYMIRRDVLFDSPSEATFVVIGRVASGWDLWKNSAGHTMRELYK